MGTHPIFESDFDCLTEMLSLLQEGFDWLNKYMGRWHYVDFSGQQRCERIFQIILVISGIIGFFYGLITESMQNTIYSIFAGFALSCFLTLPPWWFLRPQNKELKWVDEVEDDDARLFPSWASQKKSQ